MRSNYLKFEFALIAFILIGPFLIYLHVFSNEDLNTINILGFNYEHGFFSGQNFLWMLFTMLVGSLYSLLFYWTTNQEYKIFVLLPLFMWVRGLIYIFIWQFTVSPLLNHIFTVLCSLIVMYTLTRAVKTLNSMGKQNDYFLLKVIGLSNNHFFSRILTPNIYNQNIKQLVTLKARIDEKLQIQEKLSTVAYEKKWVRYLMIVGLALLLFFYFVGYFFPSDITEIKLLGKTIGSFGFIDISMMLYTVSLKFCLLIPVLLWFITSYDWWRHALLVPIIAFSYQLWELFQDAYQIDELYFVKAVPFILCLVTGLLFLSSLRLKKNKVLELYKNLCNQIDILISKEAKEQNENLIKKNDEESIEDFDIEQLKKIKMKLEAKLGVLSVS